MFLATVEFLKLEKLLDTINADTTENQTRELSNVALRILHSIEAKEGKQ